MPVRRRLARAEALARDHQLARNFLFGGMAAAAFFYWGTYEAWAAMARLERGEVHVLSLWAPVATLYRLGGRWLAMVPGALAIAVSLAAAGLGALKLWHLRGWVSVEERRALAARQTAGQPAFLRHVDESGRVPTRLRVLASILVLLLAGMAVYVVQGRAARARAIPSALSR